MNKKILIVDDETEMRSLLKVCLASEEMEILEAVNGTDALEKIRQNRVSLVILDIMMPEVDGFKLLKMLREEMDQVVPVILLSALGDTERVVKGLKLGADDYIVKPFEPSELQARVESVMRRAYRHNEEDDSFTIKGVTFYPKMYIAACKQKELPLTNKEYAILYRLATNLGRIYSREQLLSLEWGMDFVGDLRTVDTHVKNVRVKLAAAGCERQVIETVWGMGYRVNEDITHD